MTDFTRDEMFKPSPTSTSSWTTSRSPPSSTAPCSALSRQPTPTVPWITQVWFWPRSHAMPDLMTAGLGWTFAFLKHPEVGVYFRKSNDSNKTVSVIRLFIRRTSWSDAIKYRLFAGEGRVGHRRLLRARILGSEDERLRQVIRAAAKPHRHCSRGFSAACQPLRGGYRCQRPGLCARVTIPSGRAHIDIRCRRTSLPRHSHQEKEKSLFHRLRNCRRSGWL